MAHKPGELQHFLHRCGVLGLAVRVTVQQRVGQDLGIATQTRCLHFRRRCATRQRVPRGRVPEIVDCADDAGARVLKPRDH